MITPSQENARMLAAVLGIEENDAAERLDCTVLMSVAEDARSRAWAGEIRALLERTVNVTTIESPRCSVELVVGPATPQTRLRHVHAAIDAEKATIDLAPVSASPSHPHPLFAAVAASAAVAGVLRQAISAEGLPVVRYPLLVRADELGVPAEAWQARLDLAGSVLIGAGAVGHGFVRALRHVDARGTLPIIDPKKVGGGNPNRCIYLSEADVGSDKAIALARHAQGDLAVVAMTPFVEDFHAYVEREGPQKTAIVTVDSRRVRRSIQSELPGRVLDASTTDIRAVVVHSHRQPTQAACLSCIYRHVADEDARELAVAEGLGVDVAMVKESRISALAAAKIKARYPLLGAAQIEGMAYDSLFKQLCAEQALRSPEGRQVLAPFAFVSSLAGALLVVEMLRTESGRATTNYWQVDPWGGPLDRLRSRRPRVPDCEFCSKPHFRAVAEQFWGSPATAH